MDKPFPPCVPDTSSLPGPDPGDYGDEDIADDVLRAMLRRGPASVSLGMNIAELGPGRARLNMLVRQDMLNADGVCHGGIVYALADSAFAFASSSASVTTVTASATIDYFAAAPAGATLVATAQQQAASGRSGIFDVLVTTSDGLRVAMFRCKSHQIKGAHPEPSAN